MRFKTSVRLGDASKRINQHRCRVSDTLLRGGARGQGCGSANGPIVVKDVIAAEQGCATSLHSNDGLPPVGFGKKPRMRNFADCERIKSWKCSFYGFRILMSRLKGLKVMYAVFVSILRIYTGVTRFGR